MPLQRPVALRPRWRSVAAGRPRPVDRSDVSGDGRVVAVPTAAPARVSRAGSASARRASVVAPRTLLESRSSAARRPRNPASDAAAGRVVLAPSPASPIEERVDAGPRRSSRRRRRSRRQERGRPSSSSASRRRRPRGTGCTRTRPRGLRAPRRRAPRAAARRARSSSGRDVRRRARPGRDQLADDHVLLEADQVVLGAVDGGLGQHPGRLLEGGRGEEADECSATPW